MIGPTVTDSGQVVMLGGSASANTTTLQDVHTQKTSTAHRVLHGLLEGAPATALAGAAIQVIRTHAPAPVLTGLAASGFFVREGIQHQRRRKESRKKRNETRAEGMDKIAAIIDRLEPEHFPQQPWYRRIGRHSLHWELIAMPIAISLMMTFSIMLEVIGTPTETTVAVGNDTMTDSLTHSFIEKLVTDLPAQLGGRVSDFLIAFVMYWYQYLIEWNVADEKTRVEAFEKAVGEKIYQQDTKLQTTQALRAHVETAKINLADAEQKNTVQAREHQREMATSQREISQQQGEIRHLNTQLHQAVLRENNLNRQIEETARALREKENHHQDAVRRLERRASSAETQCIAETQRADALTRELDELHVDHHQFSTLVRHLSQWRQATIDAKVQRLETHIQAPEQRAPQM